MSLKPNILFLVIAALLGAPAPLCAQQQQQQQLSLGDALRLAQENNRSIASAALDIRRADENVKAAKTQRLPTFAITADFGEPLTKPYLQLNAGVLGNANGSPFPDQALRLTTSRTPSLLAFGQVEQPLSRQYQIGLQIKSLDIGKQIEAERLRASQQEIASQVRALYAQLIDEASAVDAAAADVALFTELERVTTMYVSEQTVLRSELLQVQARLQHAKYDQTTAENALASGKERLNLLMGRSVDVAFDIDPGADVAIALPTQAEALATALRLRPDLKETQLQIDRADLDRRAKKAEYIPDLSLQASYLNLTGSGLPVGGGGYAEVGLQLKWEPFDWGRKKHELEEKSAVVSQARLAAAEAQAKARTVVSSALRDAQAASQLLGATILDDEAAKEALRILQSQYAQGAALLDQVLKAQSACAQARTQVSRARAMIRTSAANLSKAMGEDL